MRVKVLNNLSYQIFPATDDMIEVDDDLISRIGIDKQFDANGNIIDYTDRNKMILDLKQNLSSTDYQAIKYAEGELTEEEYASMREQRRQWRLEINRLEEELKSGENR